MPPEQAAGQINTAGPTADVYSLGALLYATLTGRPPFQAATPLETLYQVLHREPVALRQLNAAVPRDLETIVLKCLDKTPQRMPICSAPYGRTWRRGRSKSALCRDLSPTLFRLNQILLIGTFLPLCWLAMMAVHELGHVAGAVYTGGRVEKVVLHPLTISRTDVLPNPCPLLVAWAGPWLGILLPIALLLAAKAARFTWAYLVQFFTAFCLVANGAYVGAGSLGRIGDAGDMLRHGGPIWSQWLFATVACPLGLYLWNGLGPCFGVGVAGGKVDPRAAYASCAVLLLTVILEMVLSSKLSVAVVANVPNIGTGPVEKENSGVVKK